MPDCFHGVIGEGFKHGVIGEGIKHGVIGEGFKQHNLTQLGGGGKFLMENSTANGL